jgi:hypothetical protein
LARTKTLCRHAVKCCNILSRALPLAAAAQRAQMTRAGRLVQVTPRRPTTHEPFLPSYTSHFALPGRSPYHVTCRPSAGSAARREVAIGDVPRTWTPLRREAVVMPCCGVKGEGEPLHACCLGCRAGAGFIAGSGLDVPSADILPTASAVVRRGQIMLTGMV